MGARESPEYCEQCCLTPVESRGGNSIAGRPSEYQEGSNTTFLAKCEASFDIVSDKLLRCPSALFCVSLSHQVRLHFDRGYTFVQSYRTSLCVFHLGPASFLSIPLSSFPRRSPLRRTPNLRWMRVLKLARHNPLLDQLFDVQNLHVLDH